MTSLTDIQKQHFVNAAKGLAEGIRVSGLTPQQVKNLDIRLDNKDYVLSPSPTNQYNPKAQWAGCDIIDVRGDNNEMVGTIDLNHNTFKPKGEGAGI